MRENRMAARMHGNGDPLREHGKRRIHLKLFAEPYVLKDDSTP